MEHNLNNAVWTYYNDAPFFIYNDNAGPLDAVPSNEYYDPNWGGIDMVLKSEENGVRQGRGFLFFMVYHSRRLVRGT